MRFRHIPTINQLRREKVKEAPQVKRYGEVPGTEDDNEFHPETPEEKRWRLKNGMEEDA